MYASDLTTLYFGIRIHGVTTAGVLLVAHGLGREAIHMERSQYEFFLKMLYYEHNRSKAIDFVDSIPKSAKRFADKAQISLVLSEDDLKEIEELPGDLDFVSMRRALLNDTKFTRQGSNNPIISGFLRNALASFRDHWLYASNVLHASNLDMQNVIVAKDDGFMINVDSRNKHPNRAIADFGQRAFASAVFVAAHFGIEVGDRAIELAQRLGDAASPHLEEPGSTRSMHDE